jgi:hypothetical protein
MSMSLEDKIERLTKSIEANTAALLGGKPSASASASPKAEVPAKDEAPAAEAPKRGPGRPAKPKGPTLADVTTAANGYMEANGKPAARALLQKHGSASGKLADLPEAAYAALLKEIEDSQTEGDEEAEAEAEDDGI